MNPTPAKLAGPTVPEPESSPLITRNWAITIGLAATILLFVVSGAVGGAIWVTNMDHTVKDIATSVKRIEGILNDNWTIDDDMRWRDSFFDLNPELRRPSSGRKQ